jgi:hypothetical protein
MREDDMKKSRAVALIVAALITGFVAARWCAAQPSNQPSSKEPENYDFGAMQQLESFMSYLQDTKQTNTLQQFSDYLNASLTLRQSADLGMTLTILQRLRDGRTNQAYELLEGNLDAHIVGFATSYRELPASRRNQGSLKVLRSAKEYRAKHPPKNHSPIREGAVTDAFKLLDEK